MRATVFTVLLFCIMSFVHAESQTQEIFLMSYFGHTEFETTSYSFDGLDFVFAHDKKDLSGIKIFTKAIASINDPEFTQNGTKIFTKAIAFKVLDRGIEPLLYIEEGTCYNATGELFTCHITGQTSLGWEFRFHEAVGTIATTFYSSYTLLNRLNITDGPTIEWDYENHVFKKREIDRSQW